MPEEQQPTLDETQPEDGQSEVAPEPDAQAERGAQVEKELEKAVARYRSLLLASAPDVPQELVKGETVDEVEASFQAARELVERIRQKLEAKLAGGRVPAGAPARSGPDLSTLSPREKILYGLTRGR
ncbi:MAG TPA: hypothetical protein G4O03_03650 [Dehalococcoidia bacterium]|jgi:hypothetical protein|nr:hypothetical protein [Dehalococcoidia bacterium]